MYSVQCTRCGVLTLPFYYFQLDMFTAITVITKSLIFQFILINLISNSIHLILRAANLADNPRKLTPPPVGSKLIKNVKTEPIRKKLADRNHHNGKHKVVHQLLRNHCNCYVIRIEMNYDYNIKICQKTIDY